MLGVAISPFRAVLCKIVILRSALAAREASSHYFVARAPQGRQYWAVAVSLGSASNGTGGWSAF